MQNKYVISFSLLCTFVIQAMDNSVVQYDRSNHNQTSSMFFFIGESSQTIDETNRSILNSSKTNNNNNNDNHKKGDSKLLDNIKVLVAYKWARDLQRAKDEDKIKDENLTELLDNKKKFDLSECHINDLENYITKKCNVLFDPCNFKKFRELNLAKKIDAVVLVSLLLRSNQITALPSSIGHLSSLNELDVSSNQIRQLPNELAHLTNLERLRLSNNKLTDIPLYMSNLRNLKELSMSNNEIANMPCALENLTKLVYLNLNNNSIEKVPHHISILTNLKTLDVSYNRLRQVSSEVSRLVQLETLSLEHNKLSELPMLEKLENLKSLFIHGNHLLITDEQKKNLRKIRQVWYWDNRKS